jgi:hypothetical protein
MDQVLASILKQSIAHSRLRPVGDTPRRPVSPSGQGAQVTDQLVQELRNRPPVLRPVARHNLPKALGGQRPPVHVIEEREMETGLRPMTLLKEVRLVKERNAGAKVSFTFTPVDATLMGLPLLKSPLAKCSPPPPPPLPPRVPSNTTIVKAFPKQQPMPSDIITQRLPPSRPLSSPTKSGPRAIHPSILNNPARNALMEQFRVKTTNTTRTSAKEAFSTRTFGLPIIRLPSEDADYQLVSINELPSMNGTERPPNSSTWWFWWFW